MKQQLASVLLIIISLFGLAIRATAEIHPEVTVTIPYEFVVSGRPLPAGTYTVSRLSDDHRFSGLSIKNHDTGSGIFALPNQFESRSGHDKKVKFERVGNMHFLSAVETWDGVYTLPLPRSAILMAKSPHADGVSASGTQ